MPPRIIGWQLLHGYSIAEINNKVGDYISGGWQPKDNLIVSFNDYGNPAQYFQAVVQYAEPVSNPIITEQRRIEV